MFLWDLFPPSLPLKDSYFVQFHFFWFAFVERAFPSLCLYILSIAKKTVPSGGWTSFCFFSRNSVDDKMYRLSVGAGVSVRHRITEPAKHLAFVVEPPSSCLSHHQFLTLSLYYFLFWVQ